MTNNDSSQKTFNILKIFNYAGGALIFFGIAYFVSANWYTLSDFAKIFSTLGAAIAALIIGVLLQLDQKREEAGSAFFMIAGLILPVGLFVTFKIYNLPWSVEKVELLITFLCLITFSLAYRIWPRTILLLFCVIYAAFFFLSIVDLLIQHFEIYFEDLFEYLGMIIGLSFILFGRYLELSNRPALTGVLYFMGALLLLGSSFSLSGTFLFGEGYPEWRWVTAILIMLSFILAVPFRSKAFLYLGAIFLVLYIVDMSYRFARLFGTMGWPLILIITGVLLMVIGYLLYFIHKKIASSETSRKNNAA